jgi:hypothetical protein
MKQIIDLRPVYHRLEQRIRAHVILCWLALLLIRIIETSTGTTWRHVRGEFDQLTVATFSGPTGTFIQQLSAPVEPIATALRKSVEAARSAAASEGG